MRNYGHKARCFFSLTTLFLVLCVLSGCSTWENRQGVSNKWRDESLPQIRIGEATQSDVARLLGPPSQIISMNDQLIFYYMLQKKKGKGAFFIIYNWAQINTIFDRAIFFFDQNGILTDYAYSLEKVDYKE